MNMKVMGMHLGRRRRWQDLPTGVRTAIAAVGSAQFALLAGALVDLVRRPAEQVRGGRRWVWLPVLFINTVGPLAYFAFGRRGTSTPPDGADAATPKRKKRDKRKKQGAQPDGWEM
jgi:hypothetical protein